MYEPIEFAEHSPYSNPGRFGPALRAVGPELEDIAAAARNVIGHYRAEMPDLPVERRSDIDSRWLDRILALDDTRHGLPLTEPRPPAERVAGCCRDHSLFAVGALREHGIPARNRVGFAGYFMEDYHPDHVVVEYRDGDRWVMTDPELVVGSKPFDVLNMEHGIGKPFETAAEVWLASKGGTLDSSTYGVFPGSDLCGDNFVALYVLYEVAHRYGDELLLWDEWEDPDNPFTVEDTNTLAELLVAADRDGPEAEQALFDHYRSDPRLRPTTTVTRYSPYGQPPVLESLTR